jgi:hypothetical protein
MRYYVGCFLTKGESAMTHRGSACLLVLIVSGFALVALTGTSASASPSGGKASLTVLHGLPNFTADIYVNGKLTLDGFKPESVTEPLRLPAGTYDVAIRSVGEPATSKPVLEASLTLKAGHNYTAVANLGGTGQPELSLFQNDLSPVPAGQSRLVVRNVADSPSLRVDLDGKQRFSGLGPMDQADAILPSRTYSISMNAGDGTSIGPMTIQLAEGTAQVVYVIGSASDQTLDLMVQALGDLGSTPSDVQTGTGGAAAPPGFPRWAAALLALAATASTMILVQAMRRPSQAGGH